MRFRGYSVCTALCFFSALWFCPAAALAQHSGNADPRPPNPSGFSILPSPISSAHDRSPMAHFWNFRFSGNKKPIPEWVVIGDWHYRQINAPNQSPYHVYVPSLTFSHVRSGLDVGAQYFLGNTEGYAFSVRYDLVRFRTRDVNALVDAANDWVNYMLRPRFAVFGNYNHLYGMGLIWDMGLSFSYLWPAQKSPSSSGWMLQAAAKVSNFDISGLNDSFIPWGIGIAWQDRVPRLLTRRRYVNNKEVEENELTLWRWRIAAEWGRYPLLQPNGLVPTRSFQFHDFGSPWAITVRHRDKGSGEYSLVYGKTGNNDPFFGFSIGTYFDSN